MLKRFGALELGLLCATFLLALALPTFPAFAQAAAPSTRIDFGPLLNEYVWPTIGTALLALAMWLFKLLRTWLQAKTGLELQQYDATVRAYLDQALDRAIAYGRSKVDGHATIDVKSETIAHAANYALSHVPDALRRFGIDGAALERLLEARLGTAAPASAGSG
jgi:hypothetical protein